MFTTATLQCIKQTGRSHQLHWNSENKQGVHHSNIAIQKTSKTFTTTTLQISTSGTFTTAALRTTWTAGRSPRQDCKSQSEQGIYHSNIAIHKTSRAFTAARLQITKGCTTAGLQFRRQARRLPQQDCQSQEKQGIHNSNIAIQKSSKTFTTATLHIIK